MLLALVGIVALMYAQVSGGFTLTQAGMTLVVPLVVAAAIFRPSWIVLGLIGMPPGALLNVPAVSTSRLTVVFAAILCLLLVVRGRLHLDVRSGVIPLAVLIVAAYSFRAQVGVAATGRSDQVLQDLLFYGALLLLSYNLARSGELTLDQLRNALTVGLLVTALVLFVQAAGDPLALAAEPGLLSHRTHLGYLMAMGFGLAFARPLLGRITETPFGDPTPVVFQTRFLLRDVAAISVFGVATLLSQTRGAWLAALLSIILISWMTGKHSYWLLVPALLVMVTTVPVMNERLFSDVSEGFRRSIETGQIGTGRWRLWNQLWDLSVSALPLGRGFGFTWSLTSLRLFGTSGQFSSITNPFIYPHNDFLFWFLELGLVGVGALVAFWAHLGIALKRILGRTGLVDRQVTIAVIGLFAAALMASVVDNALFIRPIAERLFLTAGFVFASAAMAPELRSGNHMGTDLSAREQDLSALGEQ